MVTNQEGPGAAAARATLAAAPTKDYQGTDIDNATRLYDLHADSLRYVHAWSTWIVWTGTVWKRDPKGVLAAERAKDISVSLYKEAAEASKQRLSDRAAALSKWARSAANRTRIDAAVALARSIPGMLIDYQDLDAEPWLLNVLNGYVDLRDGKFHEPDSSKLMTMQAPVEYDPKATAPLWEESLRQWFPDDDDDGGNDLLGYLQRLTGQAAVGQVRDHIVVVHYGGGSNGKGTFVGGLRHTFGDYFITPHKSLLVVERYSGHDTKYTDLFRTRLAVAVETEKRQKLSEASVKNLTGGDQIKGRRMYENFWSFEPTHTLWLQTNYLPEISGVDDGIWRRVKVMPWLSQFKGAQDDTRLGEKLWEELPGILNWIIAGVVAWQADGLAAPRAVLEATERYRNAEDVIGRFAKDIEMVVGADADGCFTAAKEIGKQFETWAEEEGIRSPPGAKARGEWLHAHGAERVKSRATPTAHGKQVWAWKNVEIKASLPDCTNTMSFDSKPRDVRDATAVHPREKGSLGEVQGGGVSDVSAAVKQDETDPPEHVLVGNIEPPQSADTPARWIDSSGTKRVGSERLAQHNDDNAEEATT